MFSKFACYNKQTPWFDEPIIVTHSLADDAGVLGY